MAKENRAVPYAKGKALADEYGVQFFETSAKENINVEEVRVCRAVLRTCVAHMLARASWACPTRAHALTCGGTRPLAQVFTAIAKDVMKRLQEEQAQQEQQVQQPMPMQLTNNLDKQKRKKTCC